MMSPLLAGRCKSHRVSACSVDQINTCLMKPSLCCCSGSTFTSWKRALTERQTRWGFPETSLVVFSENTFVFSVCSAACMHGNIAATCTGKQTKSLCHFRKAASAFSAVTVSVFKVPLINIFTWPMEQTTACNWEGSLVVKNQHKIPRPWSNLQPCGGFWCIWYWMSVLFLEHHNHTWLQEHHWNWPVVLTMLGIDWLSLWLIIQADIQNFSEVLLIFWLTGSDAASSHTMSRPQPHLIGNRSQLTHITIK